jgi:hypothetical protein
MLIPLQAKIADWAGTLRVAQCRIISGIRLSRKAMIAEAYGDPPGISSGVSYLELVFNQVREIVGLALIRERRPRFLLKIRVAHRALAINLIPKVSWGILLNYHALAGNAGKAPYHLFALYQPFYIHAINLSVFTVKGTAGTVPAVIFKGWFATDLPGIQYIGLGEELPWFGGQNYRSLRVAKHPSSPRGNGSDLS